MRFEERRKRENEAPRLHGEIPELKTLRLELSEYRQGSTAPLIRHTRHVVVGRAPALFVVACSDKNCDGDHDLTREMLRSLRSFEKEFQGEHECSGVRDKSTCHNQLRYQAQATYGDTLIPSQ